MDKTVKQIIKENNANGIKDIVWDDSKKRWVVYFISKWAKASEYTSFLEVINFLNSDKGH